MYDKTMKKGFSLIELLVAIAIMAVLMAFALPNYLGARERARDAKKKAELSQLKNALRMYYNDFQRYPAVGACGITRNGIGGCKVGGTSCCPCSTSFEFATSSDASCTTMSTIYMKKMPTSVVFGNNSGSTYYATTDGEQFCIRTTLENTSDPDILGNQGKCSATCSQTKDYNGALGSCTGSYYCICSD